MSFTRVTHRGRKDSKTTISFKTATEWVTDHTWNLEHPAQPVGSSTGWRVPFPGNSVDLNLFLAAKMILCFFQRLFSAAWLFDLRMPLNGLYFFLW